MVAERSFADRIENIENGMIAFQERLDSFAATMIGLGDEMTKVGISV